MAGLLKEIPHVSMFDQFGLLNLRWLAGFQSEIRFSVVSGCKRDGYCGRFVPEMCTLERQFLYNFNGQNFLRGDVLARRVSTKRSESQ